MKVNIDPYPENDEEIRHEEVIIDDYDLWDLSTTFAMIIKPALEKFKEKTFGHPIVFDTEDEWREAIDKMIYSFDQIIIYEPRICDIDEFRKHYDDINEGLMLFGKYFRHLWS